MGVLLRGPQERFNPQIHTEGNSLTTKMSKHFAVARKTFDLFKRYNKFQSWMYYTGRVNQGAKKGKMKPQTQDINDNAFRIAYEGMNILPAYATGDAHIGAIFDSGNISPDMTANGITYAGGILVSTVETNVYASVAVKHIPASEIWGDKFNPNDKFILGNGLGTQFIILSPGRLASTGDHYVYDCKVIGIAALFQEADLAEDNVLTEGGPAFGEGSLKGSQRTNKNKWRINYSFISRYTLTMTGSASRQKVAFIYNKDDKSKKMWEFDEVIRADENHRLMNEMSLRYNRITMDPTNHAWFENYGTNTLTLDGFQAESGIESPIIGNGWIPEIEDNATFDYNPNSGLAHTMIEAITNVLATRSPAGGDGNMFLAITDRIGRNAFDKGMKILMQYDTNSGTSGLSNIVYNVVTGDEMSLGFSVTSYEHLGNKFVCIEDELLNHPGLFATNGGLVGSGNIYILNATEINGVPNFEVYANTERNYNKKYVNGMHSLDPSNTGNTASSGFDGCQVHLLSELMPVLYDIRSCGILKASAVWAGGDLTGTDIANANASTFIF
jgi:hypothetical protein